MSSPFPGSDSYAKEKDDPDMSTISSLTFGNVRYDHLRRWFDDLTRSAYVEPVATVPAHRRRGLGRALVTEGLQRMQWMGATVAFVSGLSPAANALYQSIMGNDYELYAPWVRQWSC
jgi:predicted acetyltransferase